MTKFKINEENLIEPVNLPPDISPEKKRQE
jgi:hypothetical protein